MKTMKIQMMTFLPRWSAPNFCAGCLECLVIEKGGRGLTAHLTLGQVLGGVVEQDGLG